MSRQAELSIIVVNYNGRTVIGDCVESVLRHAPRAELIVVDNASTDDSRAYLRHRFPAVRVVDSPRNGGFGAGANLGVSAARGRIILLLNNDTCLQGPVDAALRQLNADHAPTVLGARLEFSDGGLQPSMGHEHTPFTIVVSWLKPDWLQRRWRRFNRMERDERRYEGHQTGLAWVSGACLFTPRATWEKLGGMDEGYFMYVEDVDFCRRVRDDGGSVAFCPTVRVMHHEVGGRPWVGADALVWTLRSYLRYVEKFDGRVWCAAVRVGLAAVMGLRSAAFVLPGLISSLGREKAAGYLRALASLQRG